MREPNMLESDKPSLRPVVVVSRCLAHEACRWNGACINDSFIQQMEPLVEFRPVCPECEIGLGVPRRPIRIVQGIEENTIELIQPTTGRVLTDTMNHFTTGFLGGLSEVDGFILKSRSPSCGPDSVKVYRGTEEHTVVARQPGFFGKAVRERFPLVALEDEGRLHNFLIREHFLTRIYTWARFRATKAHGGMKHLVEFQSANKYLLMVYSQTWLKTLGGIVANPNKDPVAKVYAAYEEALAQALLRAPEYTSQINGLEHAYGHVSQFLQRTERAYFQDLLEEYRRGGLPLSVPLGVVKAWALRFTENYILQQTLLEPYPQALVTISDSGKGREL